MVDYLVMPNLLDDTREIMRWLATELSRDTYINVMDQYFPAWKVTGNPRYGENQSGACAIGVPRGAPVRCRCRSVAA